MPGAFFEIEGLVNCPVEVHEEVRAQPTVVVEDAKALPARPRGVVVKNDLVDDLLEQRQVPAAAADPLDLLFGEILAAEVVVPARPRVVLFRFIATLPEPRLRPVRVVSVRIQPEHDRRPGAKELARRHDLVAVPVNRLSGSGRGAGGAPGGERQGGEEGESEDRWMWHGGGSCWLSVIGHYGSGWVFQYNYTGLRGVRKAEGKDPFLLGVALDGCSGP